MLSGWAPAGVARRGEGAPCLAFRTDRYTPDADRPRHHLTATSGGMSSAVAAKGIACVPTKTHKLPEIAACNSARARGPTWHHREIEYSSTGADDVFITYPLWIGTRQTDRLRQLFDRARIAVGWAPPSASNRRTARERRWRDRCSHRNRQWPITAAASVPNKCWRSPAVEVRLGSPGGGVHASPVTSYAPGEAPAKPASKRRRSPTTCERWS